MIIQEQHQLMLIWHPHCYIRADFMPSSNVSIADFEHIISGWNQCDAPHVTIIC